MSIVDGLCRLPIVDPDIVNRKGEYDCDVAFTFDDILNSTSTSAEVDIKLSEYEWNDGMQKDICPELGKGWLQKGWPAERNIKGEFSSYWNVKDKLSHENNIVLRSDKVIPSEGMHKIIVQIGHRGHCGMSITKCVVKQGFWWPGMDYIIDKCVRECSI